MLTGIILLIGVIVADAFLAKRQRRVFRRRLGHTRTHTRADTAGRRTAKSALRSGSRTAEASLSGAGRRAAILLSSGGRAAILLRAGGRTAKASLLCAGSGTAKASLLCAGGRTAKASLLCAGSGTAKAALRSAGSRTAKASLLCAGGRAAVLLCAGGRAAILLRAGGRAASRLGGGNRTGGPIRCLRGSRPDRLSGLDRLSCLNRLNRLLLFIGGSCFLWRGDCGRRSLRRRSGLRLLYRLFFPLGRSLVLLFLFFRFYKSRLHRGGCLRLCRNFIIRHGPCLCLLLNQLLLLLKAQALTLLVFLTQELALLLPERLNQHIGISLETLSLRYDHARCLIKFFGDFFESDLCH